MAKMLPGGWFARHPNWTVLLWNWVFLFVFTVPYIVNGTAWEGGNNPLMEAGALVLNCANPRNDV